MKKLLLTAVLLLMACHPYDTYEINVLQQPTPIASPSPTNSFIGCFTDTSVRALPVFLIQTGATVEACIAVAKAAGYAFAGVQYGTQCFAGDTIGYTQVVTSECNMPCQADTSEICGGDWLNSVYSTGL